MDIRLQRIKFYHNNLHEFCLQQQLPGLHQTLCSRYHLIKLQCQYIQCNEGHNPLQLQRQRLQLKYQLLRKLVRLTLLLKPRCTFHQLSYYSCLQKQLLLSYLLPQFRHQIHRLMLLIYRLSQLIPELKYYKSTKQLPHLV